jgi:hypothetical protein
MKKISLSLILISFFRLTSFSQGPPASTTPSNPPANINTTPGLPVNDYGWSNRVGFIVGAGPSVIIGSIFQDISISKADNIVHIDYAPLLKTSVTLGITYTPYLVDNARKVKSSVDNNGNPNYSYFVDHYPKGISFALFINPINLNSYTGTSSISPDIGLGIGGRWGSFSTFLTAEFFSLRQPQQYFIDQYRGRNISYTVNKQIQSTIDVNDNSIYTSRMITAIGLKLAYTFDIVKSYYTASR